VHRDFDYCALEALLLTYLQVSQ